MKSVETQSVKKSARFSISRGMKTVLIALVVLYLASYMLAPTSVSRIAQMGMLPFAAVLAIIGLGQTLVIQQGGIDLSVAGSVNTNNLNVSTANITYLTGTSNTAIYTTISAAIDSSIAFSIALG